MYPQRSLVPFSSSSSLHPSGAYSYTVSTGSPPLNHQIPRPSFPPHQLLVGIVPPAPLHVSLSQPLHHFPDPPSSPSLPLFQVVMSDGSVVLAALAHSSPPPQNFPNPALSPPPFGASAAPRLPGSAMSSPATSSHFALIPSSAFGSAPSLTLNSPALRSSTYAAPVPLPPPSSSLAPASASSSLRSSSVYPSLPSSQTRISHYDSQHYTLTNPAASPPGPHSLPPTPTFSPPPIPPSPVPSRASSASPVTSGATDLEDYPHRVRMWQRRKQRQQAFRSQIHATPVLTSEEQAKMRDAAKLKALKSVSLATIHLQSQTRRAHLMNFQPHSQSPEVSDHFQREPSAPSPQVEAAPTTEELVTPHPEVLHQLQRLTISPSSADCPSNLSFSYSSSEMSSLPLDSSRLTALSLSSAHLPSPPPSISSSTTSITSNSAASFFSALSALAPSPSSVSFASSDNSSP